MLSNYHRLLLDVLHIDPERPDKSKFVGFEAGDWNAFIHAAVEYGLTSQVTEFLASNSALKAHVPIECQQVLHQALEAQLHQNFRQYRRLKTVLMACSDAGIRVILFKGLWLIEHVYRDPKARRSGDIDLLIHPDDMHQFTQLARGLGCRIPDGVTDLRLLVPTSNEYPLMYRNDETRLDIHWAVTRPPFEQAIDEESIWTNAEPTRVGGAPCWTFSLEDNLLYLCFHTAIHHRFAYVGPRALLDITLMLTNPYRAIDWDQLVPRAHSLGWSRGVWLTLSLVQNHFGARVPEYVLRSLQPDETENRDILDQAMEALFLDHNDPVTPDNLLILAQASWFDNATLVFRRLFPPREEVATQFMVPVGSKGFWLNYFRRFVRLSAHVPIFWSILRGDKARLQENVRTRAIQEWLGP